MHFPFLWGWGVWGTLSEKMLSTDCFLMGFALAHAFHNKKIIFAGIEKLTEKNCRNSRENPKEVSELCSLSVHHSYVLLDIHSGDSFCPHQQGRVLCCLGRCCSLGSDLQRFPGKHLCPEAESHSAALVLVHTGCSKLVQKVLMTPYTQRGGDTHLLYTVSN